MPGHCLAALAAHPEYACTPGPFTVATEKGIYDGVFCPGEETFAFLDDVLKEAPEQEHMEAWIMGEVDKGAALPGLYPMNAETKARYDAWAKKGGK